MDWNLWQIEDLLLGLTKLCWGNFGKLFVTFLAKIKTTVP